MSQHLMLAAGSGGAAATTQTIAFWALAVISVGAALGMIVARRAVHCAVLLAMVMLALAVLYALQGAPFLAFVQVIVYTGAVLMLFLFVLMIVGISSADSLVETIRGQRLAAGLAGIGLLVLLSLIIGHAAIGPAAASASGPAFGNSNLQGVATLIFTRYVFPFEVTSALLITAALGAMVLAHRERTSPKPTQRDLARRRIAGGHPTPLPGPGTYARHNAVDMPALLPDGSPSELSVSPVISRRGLRRQPPPPGLPAGPGEGAAPAGPGRGAAPAERGESGAGQGGAGEDAAPGPPAGDASGGAGPAGAPQGARW
jgi:NADH-quinone oxidoreductase subunit J